MPVISEVNAPESCSGRIQGTVLPMPQIEEPKIISGNANKTLATAVARRMSMHRGMSVSLVDARVERFNDGEIFVEVFENVRGEDMFILQSTSESRQRQPDGTADHGRRPPPVIGPADYRRDPLFRLCPPGSPHQGTNADHRETRRQHDGQGRDRAGADDGPARSPDPGLLSTSRSTTSMPRRSSPSTS